MEVRDIHAELPKLTFAQLHEALDSIGVILGEREDIEICEAMTREDFIMMDQMEAEDEARASQ